MKRGTIALLGCLTAGLLALVLADDPPSEGVYGALDTLAEIIVLAEGNSPSEDPERDLFAGAIEGILENLDPHSDYYDPDRFLTMKEDQQGSFFGIGVIVGNQNDRLTIVSALAGGPAARAGMRAGDVMVRIDGVDTERMKVRNAVRLLRGERGSEVTIAVSRQGRSKPIVMVLPRQEIPSNNVRAAFMLDEKTGYVMLSDFGETASQELRAALLDLETAGMKQCLLDLRGNPGGLLPQAIQVTSLFLPGSRLVVSTKGRVRSANREYSSERRSDISQLPLIVLINRGSASASEIVAGALQDHDRGLIVGESSWGKGLVQSVFPLADGKTGLALTTSRYYTPSGRNIQGSYTSWEDYFNPVSPEQEFFSRAEKETARFSTTKGRTVYQVRGITPDVFIPPPDDSDLLLQLRADHNAFFNFATVHQDKVDVSAAGWEADATVVSAFFDYLSREGIASEGLASEDLRERVRQWLTHDLLLIGSSMETESRALRYQLQNDTQLITARLLFPRAEELLRFYNDEAPLPGDYAKRLIQFAEMHRETGTH